MIVLFLALALDARSTPSGAPTSRQGLLDEPGNLGAIALGWPGGAVALSGAIPQGHHQTGLGIQLNWEAFDGRRRLAERRTLWAQAQLARLGGGGTPRGRSARSASAAVEAVEAWAALAKEDLALARRGLGSGANTLFDIQGAQPGVASARLARTREATVDLLLAMGAS